MPLRQRTPWSGRPDNGIAALPGRASSEDVLGSHALTSRRHDVDDPHPVLILILLVLIPFYQNPALETEKVISVEAVTLFEGPLEQRARPLHELAVLMDDELRRGLALNLVAQVRTSLGDFEPPLENVPELESLLFARHNSGGDVRPLRAQIEVALSHHMRRP